MILIRFPNYFDPTDPKTDIHILEKLTTPSELSGLLNLALDGLHRLLQHGYFTNEKTLQERKYEYIKASDPIHYFAKHHIVKDVSVNFISNSHLYDAYHEMCVHELQALPRTNSVFIKHLARFLPYKLVGWEKNERNRNVKGFRGIRITWKLKEQTDTLLETGDTAVNTTEDSKVTKPPKANSHINDLDTIFCNLNSETSLGALRAFDHTPSLLERVESYIYQQKDVGCLKVSIDLDIPPHELTSIIASSPHLILDDTHTTVRWSETPFDKTVHKQGGCP
jgi:hypothetical protein